MASWVPSFNNSVDTEIDKGAPFITCQYATVDKNGFPHVRTMVYRGFLFNDKCNNILSFVTDRRMEKYQEILHNDKVEVAFYFPSVRKQYRFRGLARIIDKDFKPVIDNSKIQPSAIIANNKFSSGSDSEDENEEDPEEGILDFTKQNSQVNGDDKIEPQNRCPINTPVAHHVISPAVADTLNQYKTANNLSYTNLHDLGSVDMSAPSEEEWNKEIQRQWENLSKKLKSSFRKPPPKTLMDNDKRKIIDRIGRGVDGKKEEAGLENFAVIAIFTDYVDMYDLEKDRRWIFEKDNYHLWKEEEVCP